MTDMWLYIIFTCMFISIFSSFIMILSKNPIYSIFSLILSILSAAIILLLSKIEFLAYIFIIVYVGAIAVLFLFVIMMLNIKVSQSTIVDFSTWEFYCLLLFFPKMMLMVKVVIESYFFEINYYSREISEINDLLQINKIYSDVYIFSNLLYDHFAFVFLLSGVVLLISMIGALVITSNKNIVQFKK